MTTPALPRTWRDQAARCARHPERWEAADAESRFFAVQQCHACPLEAGCLRWALSNGEFDRVRGGKTPDELSQLWWDAPRTETTHVPSRGHYNSGCREPGCVAENTRYVASLRACHTAVEAEVSDSAQLVLEVIA